jgi:hypothetical protein
MSNGPIAVRTSRFVAPVSALVLLLAACRDAPMEPGTNPQPNLATAPGPQAYVYTIVADSERDNFDPFDLGCPAINDAGVVAFRARRDGGVTGVFRGRGGALAVIALSSRNNFNFIGFHPSINNTGAVSFAANRSEGELIARGRGGPLTPIARTEPGIFEFFGFDTSVNDSGVVAFKAELDNFDEGLFFGAGAGTTTVYLASTSQFQGNSVGPAINNRGHIAFQEDLDAGGSGVFLWNGASFITIATDGGPIGSFSAPPSLNDNGAVAFDAFLDNGDGAILRGNGGALTTIASTAGPFSSFNFNGPAINNAGRVAFAATLDAGGDGIFITPNPSSNPVIQTGDALAGSTVTSLVFCREGLSSTGQVAFQAQLSDGRAVIARATN